MAKIPILTDTHCGIRNSSQVFIDYQEKFYRDVFFPYCKENNVKTILHGGDYYDHRKYVNFKAQHSNRKMFLEPLRQMGMHMDIIPGNHDVFYKNTNELCSLKELLGFYTANVNIIMQPTVNDYNGLHIAMLPWVNNSNYTESVDFIKQCKAPWLLGHLELDGFEMMKGIKCEHGLSRDLFKRFEKVMSGHFHTKSEQDNITYLGSQMEFFWNDAHDKKYFHILDTDTRQLTAVRNPHTLFHRIVYDDTKHDYLHYPLDDVEGKFVKVVVINKSDTFTFDRFIDRIQNRNILELKIAENFNEFVGSAVDDESVLVDDTPTLLNSYIDNVDTDLDKDRIKLEMSNLMIEAQSLEIA